MFFGGVKPGKRNRGAVGKALVVIAVGQRVLKGYTLASMAVIPYVTAPILRGFLQDHVERKSDVFGDAFRSYPLTAGDDFIHKPFNVAASGVPSHVPLPSVHRVASLAKHWPLESRQGRSKSTTYRPISTSSASGATGAARGREACCSFTLCSMPLYRHR